MVCRQNLYHRIPRKLTPIVYYDYYQNDEYDDYKRKEKKKPTAAEMCRKKYVIQKLIVHMSVWYLFYSKMEDDVKQRVTPFALYYAMCSHVSFAL